MLRVYRLFGDNLKVFRETLQLTLSRGVLPVLANPVSIPNAHHQTVVDATHVEMEALRDIIHSRSRPKPAL